MIITRWLLQECKNRFGAGTYYEHEGKPYCELHYHQHRGSLCAACNKPISGRFEIQKLPLNDILLVETLTCLVNLFWKALEYAKTSYRD